MSIKHNNTGFNVEFDEKNTCFTTNQLENTIKSIFVYSTSGAKRFVVSPCYIYLL